MGGGAIKTCQITSLTLSKSFNTWLFQNRNTLNPRASSQAVRFASEADCSKCCPPSTSTINFLSRHTKSTIYGPKGAVVGIYVPPLGAGEGASITLFLHRLVYSLTF